MQKWLLYPFQIDSILKTVHTQSKCSIQLEQNTSQIGMTHPLSSILVPQNVLVSRSHIYSLMQFFMLYSNIVFKLKKKMYDFVRIVKYYQQIPKICIFHSYLADFVTIVQLSIETNIIFEISIKN